GLDQQCVRFCSRSTLCFTLSGARGYFRSTSPSEAQAASFSPNAASDWPSRNNASGACAVFSYLVETVRNDSAASRYCLSWNRLSPSQYCASGASRSLGYLRKKSWNVCTARVKSLCSTEPEAKSYWSFGVSPGGSAACTAPGTAPGTALGTAPGMAPVPLGLIGGGGGRVLPADALTLPVGGAEGLERSSGAPA